MTGLYGTMLKVCIRTYDQHVPSYHSPFACSEPNASFLLVTTKQHLKFKCSVYLCGMTFAFEIKYQLSCLTILCKMDEGADW